MVFNPAICPPWAQAAWRRQPDPAVDLASGWYGGN
jgi:hypothetical protein